ncbi:MAG: hypothetical protein V1827_04010 [Candidatus Micrarchaeota archaeon]
MCKILYAVIALSLASIAFAGLQDPWVDRTWVASNPHIWTFGAEFWWNLPALHETIESIDAGRAGSLDLPEEVQDDVAKAASSSKQASDRKTLCTINLISSLGAGQFMFSQLFMNAFSESSGCTSYKASWKEAVGAALDAADMAASDAEGSVSGARTAYEELVFMGVCESGYSGPGSGPCPELRSAFDSVDNNITEGRYGKSAILQGYLSEMKGRLKEPAPDLSRWASLIELVYGEQGVKESFDKAKAAAISSKTASQNHFTELSASASARKSAVEKSLAGLKAQKLYLIDKAPSGYEARIAGSVSESFTLLSDDKEDIDAIFTEASLVRGRTSQTGYMASAIGRISSADQGYSEISEAADALEEDAADAVGQARDEAQSEISASERAFSISAGSTSAADSIDEARILLEKGDSAALMGERFAYYSKAAALARTARDEGSLAEEASTGASFELLEDLIKGAEKDGINVAQEKEMLVLVKSLPPADAEALSQGAIGSIIAKAEARYDSDILSARSRIYDKLSFAGPDAADLETDMLDLENGLLSDGAVVYPEAIGSLSALLSGYEKIENELDQYMGDVIGNSMSADSAPLIGPVKLDGPVPISLDAVLTNPRPYSAAPVSVLIRTTPLGFVYSDITDGKDEVAGVREDDDGLIVAFREVRPYETKRVSFEKSSIIAHTLERTVVAEGIGDGTAIVKESIEFALDIPVMAVASPEGCAEMLIDGTSNQAALSAGTHTLTCERTVYEAYSESMANMKAYPLGAMSKVEYDIRIEPEMDLDRVIIFIDSMNDSAITRFSVIPATGEAIKEQGRLSDTQYFAKLSGLKKGRTAVLRISYTVDDTPGYVQRQLSALQGADLSQDALGLLEDARMQAEAGNCSRALELISLAVAKSREDESARSILEKRYDVLLGALQAELTEIDQAMQSAPADSDLGKKLSSRKSELLKVISEAEAGDLAEGIATLEETDPKWLEKEISSYRKEAYKSYNDLKERFFLCGNSTTPAEFLLFEEALRKLETGDRPEYAAQAAQALLAVENTVKAQESSLSAQKEALKALFGSAKSDASSVLERYLNEASAARGTEYSGYFTETESKVNKLIKDAESALKGDPRAAISRIEDLNSSRAKMEATLAVLEDESTDSLLAIEALIRSKDLDEGRKASLQARIEGIRSMISAEEYVNALRAAGALTKEIGDAEAPAQDGLMILALTAMAILSAAGFYMYKQQKPKELKKLSSWGDLKKPVDKENEKERRKPKEGVISSSPSPPSARSSPS